MRRVIQYKHRMDLGLCFAVVPPTPSYILSTISHNTPGMKVEMEIGLSKKHPDDRYVKAEGRRLAKERMQSVTAKLHTFNMYLNQETIMVTLEYNGFLFEFYYVIGKENLILDSVSNSKEWSW